MPGFAGNRKYELDTSSALEELTVQEGKRTEYKYRTKHFTCCNMTATQGSSFQRRERLVSTKFFCHFLPEMI